MYQKGYWQTSVESHPPCGADWGNKELGRFALVRIVLCYATSVQAMESKDIIQSVKVPHINVRKYLRFAGGGSNIFQKRVGGVVIRDLCGCPDRLS